MSSVEQKEYWKRYYRENIELSRAKKMEYYWEHREEIRLKKKEYYQKNRERFIELAKEYNQDNLEKRREKAREYYYQHREGLTERRRDVNKQYYQKNKERIQATSKLWRESFNGKLYSQKDNMRRRTGCETSEIDRVINDNFLKYGAYCCEKCRVFTNLDYQLDHIIPVSKGGNNRYENLQLLCRECNAHKGVRIEDYRCRAYLLEGGKNVWLEG